MKSIPTINGKLKIRSLHANLLILLLASAVPYSSTLAASDTSAKCPGQKGFYYTNDKTKRNPRLGGFVSESANVGDYVFIAPTAAVCDSASVLEFARVYGNAVVKGEAEVTGKARVYGNAVVSGEAVVAEDAKISGHAHVTGSADIRGKAWVKGYLLVSEGSKTKGKFTAPKPKAVSEKEKRIAAMNKSEEDRKNKAKMLKDAKYELESFQRKLKQGWFGEDKREGFYRSFKFAKSDTKPPCGFYLRLTKEQKTLDSHCRRTKQVYNPKWILKSEKYKTVKVCKTEYEDQGEIYFDLKKVNVSTHHDFNQRRVYLHLNKYYFYVEGGNERKVKEYGEKIKAFSNKYCR